MNLPNLLKLLLKLLLLLLPTQLAAAVDAVCPRFEQPRAQGLCDLDGDGAAERIEGDSRGVIRGRRVGTAIVVHGKTGRTLFTFAGDSTGDRFGWSVGIAGDVDGDGVVDFVVGAPLDDVGGRSSGSVFVFSGRDGSQLYRFTGSAAGQQFGYSVAAAGDVNGDGHADIRAGAPFADVGGRNAGFTRVLSGKDGSVLRTVHGAKPNEKRGKTL
jgi:FG-GAP repeat